MIQKLLNRFEYLNHLIRTQQTGTPAQLAENLGINQRAWYKIRDELINDLDVPIRYCAYRKTYYYEHDGDLIFEFRQRKLPDSDLENLSGGCLLSISYNRINFFEKSWPLHF